MHTRSIQKNLNKIGIYLFVLTNKLCSRWMPTNIYIRLLFRFRFGYSLNLKVPETFNEKIQWLKIHDKNPEYTIDVDKYLVRNRVKDLLGEEYLVPLLGHYTSAKAIRYDDLPEQFVLKCTHGTHCSIICRDKKKFDKKLANQLLEKWLRHNYYYDAREWPYKNVKPSIICEKYIADKNDTLIDYKYLCFDGKVEYIMVHQDINNEKKQHTLDIYTKDWVKTDIKWGVPNSNSVLPKPERFDECVHVCEILSKNRPHVRVDLYVVNGKIYFGELTYYSAAGFKPFDNVADDYNLGKLINIQGMKHEENRPTNTKNDTT